MAISCKISPCVVNKDGYPVINSKTYGHARHHRLVYSMTHDNYKFKDGEDVMHLCNERRCIEPSHLVLGNQTENNRYRDSLNRQAKGEQNGRAKLTEKQVRKIRKLGKEVPAYELAEMFGVAKRTISSILSRTTWKHLD